jgi:hypothetical protein
MVNLMVLFFDESYKVISYDCGHSCHLSFVIAGTDTTVTFEVLFWSFIWNLMINFGLLPVCSREMLPISQKFKPYGLLHCAQIVVHCKNQMQLLFYMSGQI